MGKGKDTLNHVRQKCC